MLPAAQQVLAIDSEVDRRRLLDGAAVTVPLQRERIARFGKPIHSKPARAHAPIVGRVVAVGQNRIVAVEIFSKDTEINVFAELAAVTRGAEIIEQSSASSRQQRALSVPGAFGDDID